MATYTIPDQNSIHREIAEYSTKQILEQFIIKTAQRLSPTASENVYKQNRVAAITKMSLGSK